MRALIIVVVTILGGTPPARATPEPPAPCGARARFRLLVHGGAGALASTPEQLQHKRQLIERVLRAGETLLRAGGHAVDAVEQSVRQLEDSPLFNAGRGGIPNKAGFVELDASIMDGWTRNAGAVAAVRRVKNPIRAARAAMERSEHLMFVDRGAEAFARSMGLEIVAPEYFLVPGRRGGKGKSGTVGAVALDRCGQLAAGTSTGGYSSKTPGRVGDSPIIGAGTYATRRCAVSATGHGEFFIRWAAAFDVCALQQYKGYSIKRAATTVIERRLKPAGGLGGFIALDARGRMAWPYSSPGMIRGYVTERGELKIGVRQAMQ